MPGGNKKKHQNCHIIETSHLICRSNQLTGFYMIATLAFNELMENLYFETLSDFANQKF